MQSFHLPKGDVLRCISRTANERTYLAYFRTASAFANLGIVVRQLFLLQNQNTSNSAAASPYGEALAIACLILAIVVACSGAFRFWRQQNAMARLKAYAGGWELWIVALAGLLVRSICLDCVTDMLKRIQLAIVLLVVVLLNETEAPALI